jgi:hypothetical protein
LALQPLRLRLLLAAVVQQPLLQLQVAPSAGQPPLAGALVEQQALGPLQAQPLLQPPVQPLQHQRLALAACLLDCHLGRQPVVLLLHSRLSQQLQQARGRWLSQRMPSSAQQPLRQHLVSWGVWVEQ